MEPEDQVAGPGIPKLLRSTCVELVAAAEAEACILSRVIGELLIGVTEHSASGRRVSLGHGYLLPDYPLTQEVVELREPRAVSVLDPAADPKEADLLREMGFESLLMLPLEARGECWGLVELYGHGDGFGDDVVARVRPLLAQATALLEAP